MRTLLPRLLRSLFAPVPPPGDRLAVAESAPLDPSDLSKPPIVVTDPQSLRAVEAIAKLDAAALGFEQRANPPTPPSGEFVGRLARAKLDRLGERAWQVVRELDVGRLGEVQPQPIKRTLAVKPLAIFGFVVLAGVVTEIVYGQNAAQILTGGTPRMALLGAIGFTVAVNVLAYAAAGIVYAASPNFLVNRGARVGAATLLLLVTLAAVMGLVVGGFDPADPVGGGIAGGGVTTVGVPDTPDTRPLLAAAYFGILAVIALASFLAHLLYLHEHAALRTRKLHHAQRDARVASLDELAQRRAAVAVLRAHIEAVPVAHAHGRVLIAAYAAALRRELDPDLRAHWVGIDYDDTDPQWLAEIARQITAMSGPHQKTSPIVPSVTPGNWTRGA
jgi:hypothetical protein